MSKIRLRASSPFKSDGNIWAFLFRQILYIALGALLYFIISWLNVSYFQMGVRNVSFYPATAIVALFGVVFGPLVGLFTGLLGKTALDYVADWGFYWNGILAYGLIGLIAGFGKVAIQDFRSIRQIAGAILWSCVGALVGALVLAVPEVFLGEISLKIALLNNFLPEFIGNLVVIVVLLPLSMLAVAALNRNQ